MAESRIIKRNVRFWGDVYKRQVYNLVDVIEGKCRLKQALIKDKKYPELCLLPSAQTTAQSWCRWTPLQRTS